MNFRVRATAIRNTIAVVLCLGLVVSASEAFAACSAGTAPADKISAFTRNPSSLLSGQGGARTGGEVASDVRDLVISDPTTLPLIIGLLKTDSPPSAELQRAI